MIKNIIFDCSDTLLRFRSVDLLTELCGSRKRAEELHLLFLTNDTWALYDNGKISTEALTTYLQSLVPAEEQHIPALYLARYPSYFTPIDGMPALLAELKDKGYRIYLLSDFPETFDALPKQFDFFALFDELVVSYRVGISKRDGDIFAYILDHCGLNAAECLFVDDMPHNVAKAETYGINAHRFDGVAGVRARLGL